MLTKQEKEQIVDELAQKLGRQKVAIFSDFHGTSVARAQVLRRELKKSNAEYRVAKKTLLSRSFEKAGISLNVDELKGEISVTFGYGDEALPAKTLFKFSKENEMFKILGGLLGERFLTEGDVIRLAKLPSREILLSQVAGALHAPLRGFANALSGNMRNLVVVLNKIKEQK